MILQRVKYTLSSLLVLGLSACTSEDLQGNFDRTADGPIEFTVGVESSPARRALTRAGEATPTYYALKEGTQLRLKVDGTWASKNPSAISQKTTCTTVAAESGSAINTLSFTEGETLYWDDYGTGDPLNAENKAKGLSVLAVAVDGKGESPKIETDAEWESKAWNVVTNGTDVLSGDILVSNNLTGYKFADRNDDEAKKMIFKHPLSKITINLTAADGFTKGTVGTTKYKFEKDPTVTLTNATTLAGISNNDNNYALTKGTVSISAGTATSDDTKEKLIAGTTSITDENITVIKQAIVYPGTQLGASNDAVISVIQADDNVYFIKAKEIHDAMYRVGHTDYKTRAGYNYILNITLKKSGVIFTATVTEWNDVNSDVVDPRINVGDVYGTNGNKAFDKTTFSFYRSTELDKGYSEDDKSTMSFANNSWTMSPQRYWPDHLTHYQFRGVWPETTTNTNVSNAPRIETDTNGKQVIKVHNVAYTKDTYPSDLMIARPEIDTDKECTNKEVGHTTTKLYDGGICATEGNINLNFRYMMAQVEVNLSTETEEDKKVNLTDSKVELVGVYNGADVTLGGREVIPTGDTGNYTLDGVTDEANKRLSAIVPQDLSRVKFRITLSNGDVYYADAAAIKEATSGNAITKWESGQHYVYNLKLSKTQLTVSVTLTDWKKVVANENVWF